MVSNPPFSSSTTIFHATRTTTFTTTLTAHPNQPLVTIQYPWPATTVPLEFTTRPPPPNPSSRDFPEVIPILVLTDVVAIIVNTAGIQINEGTRIQRPSHPSTAVANTTNHNGVVAAYVLHCSGFACWTLGQQIGTTVSIIILGPLILYLIVFCLFVKPRVRVQRQGSARRDTGGRRRKNTRGPIATFFLGKPRRARRNTRQRPRSRSSSSSSGTSLTSQRLQRTRGRETSSVRDIRGSKIINPQDQHPAGSAPTPQPDFLPRGRSLYYQPPGSSHNRQQYSPIPQRINIRDFAYPPRAGFVGGQRPRAPPEPPLLMEKTRRRSRGASASRLPIRARSSRIRGGSAPSTRLLVVEGESRSQEPPRYVGQSEKGPIKKIWRSRSRSDEEHARRSRRRVSHRKGDRRRARSFSPRRIRHSRVTSKRRRSDGLSRIWDLLPLALAATHDLSEPKRGWEPYHHENKCSKSLDREQAHKRRHISSCRERAPSRSRSLEEDTLKRKHQATPPQRQQSTRQDMRDRQQRYSTGLDGPSSTDGEEERPQTLQLQVGEELGTKKGEHAPSVHARFKDTVSLAAADMFEAQHLLLNDTGSPPTH